MIPSSIWENYEQLAVCWTSTVTYWNYQYLVLLWSLATVWIGNPLAKRPCFFRDFGVIPIACHPTNALPAAARSSSNGNAHLARPACWKKMEKWKKHVLPANYLTSKLETFQPKLRLWTIGIPSIPFLQLLPKTSKLVAAPSSPPFWPSKKRPSHAV